MTVNDLDAKELENFYGTYLSILNKDQSILAALDEGKEWIENFIAELDDDKLQHRYAEGKWTIAEVLVHIIDTERIFQYRAFRFSRNDKTALPGFEQDGYVFDSNSNERSKASILEEYLTVRNATFSLFKNLETIKLSRKGIASNLEWSVAALGLTISGHQKHHANILVERYL